MNNGRYRLIQECKKTGERVYFNFEANQFYDYSEKENKQVSLASIDSITTLFPSEQYFIDSLKNSGFNTSDATMFISYKLKGERKLAPVFNDSFLQYVAQSTLGRQDGTVDVDKALIMEELHKMFLILCRPENGLYDRILNKRLMGSNTYGMSDKSFSFLTELPGNVYNGTIENEEFYFKQFKHRFSSYKELRGLYLNYVGYQKELAKKRQAAGYTYQLGGKK